ncbi:MAG: TraR/DksA C4-type zinc finger protein [Devosia sp.]|nr:TraR/DksA C4-type zinc finger protein [Devosia sp.]
MSGFGERDFETAQLRIEQERSAGIGSVLAAMGRTGSDTCDDCGEMIGAARRQAMPSARRCVSCQSTFERA